MKLNAIVKEDGTLIARAPKSLRGKKVKISLEEKKKKKSLSAWDEISNIFKEADTLGIPPRDLQDILNDMRGFRESR